MNRYGLIKIVIPIDLRKIIKDNNYYEYIKQQSKKMIEIIGFKNDDIDNYLKLYLNLKFNILNLIFIKVNEVLC